MKSQGLGITGWGLGIAFRWRFLVIFISLGLAGSAAKAEDENLRITVRVYDYAQVSQELLAEAEKEAAHILSKAGLQTEWLACSVKQAEGESDAACERPLGPNDLILRILPKSMAARLLFRNLTLGFAWLTEEGGYGFVAGILYHKVESLAEETNLPRHYILAHAIAHEIGHLLLRTFEHTGRGLMRAHWTPGDLHEASRGQLPFTPQEGARLRAEVRARASAESPLEEGRRLN